MRFFTSVLVVCLAFGLAACGGGESSTTSETSAVSAAESAQIEVLKLEKEKAEVEAEAAKAEAKSQKREAAQAARAAQKAQTAPEPEPEPEPAPEEAPDVVGMPLPQAEAALRAAGYETNAENTDTTFGIVVPSHYTVCEQDDPLGSLVTVLAQKYGC